MDSSQYRLKATLTQLCLCSRGVRNVTSEHPEQQDSSLTLWRPWLLRAGDRELDGQQRRLGEADGDHRNTGPKGALGFQHPVRLYMPKSKTSEYLQHMGKKVLANFPVQATIHFYNDDSDSEEEEEDDEMEFYNYYQNCAANGVNSSRGSGDNYSVPGGPKRNISSHTGSA
ncbi:protein ripply3 [Xenopus tropicalis]|uniref:Protein ripply3 n=1 Tax=Xenopus tropicalis TaxID=8364 RepID=DSCR6_XENTR|nr:protein ripply3 [Xenopus tropicalis]B1H3B4.1 RecName: Full=Protein ripply3; AltName: Full=Down syndrome critical region protein 6 homolog [Xenopus tropicalis]AAI61333.1 LOC100145593 protein [Xenopus tropicalis]|eukprot:NP_001120477.1 protein ripply3 [Xenopus tropicalis]